MNAVNVRLALYVLSSALVLLASAFAGWGVSFNPDTNILSINVETLVSSFLGGGGLSALIFQRWGVR